RARGKLLPVRCCLVTIAESHLLLPLPASAPASSNPHGPREPSGAAASRSCFVCADL
ncbi:unnamed protein product, partial [Bubo scandiacus]